MSMIEEALRRIQDPTIAKSQTGQAEPEAKPKAGATSAPPAHSWPAKAQAGAPGAVTTGLNPLTAVGLSVLALGVLLVAGSLLWFSRSMQQPHQPQTASRSRAPIEELELTQAPPPQAALPDPITLTNASLQTEAKQAPAFTMPWVRIQQPKRPEEFVLSGVVEGSGEPYAVINDMIVGIGEQIEGATLAGIERGVVTLRRSNGQEFALEIDQ